jgi:ABC-type sugar transport system permease subunit
MTNGGPLYKTMTPVLYIMHSRSNGNISDSEITAMAILVMIIILLINSCVFYLFRDKEEQGR